MAKGINGRTRAELLENWRGEVRIAVKNGWSATKIYEELRAGERFVLEACRNTGIPMFEYQRTLPGLREVIRKERYGPVYGRSSKE